MYVGLNVITLRKAPRTRLKIVRGNSCGFDSRLRHQHYKESLVNAAYSLFLFNR